MHFGHCKALDELERAGARVDREAGVARLPADLVEQTVAQLPRSVLLAGATPDDDCLLEPGTIHFSPSGSPNVTLDFETGEYRPEHARRRASRDDRRRRHGAGRHPLVALSAPPTSSPSASLFRELLTSSPGDPKHIQDDVTYRWQVEPMLAICAAALRRPRGVSRAAAHQLRLLHHVAAGRRRRAARRVDRRRPATVARSSSIPCRSPAPRRR